MSQDHVSTEVKTPATAAGQALGYSLQYTRLTAMLLDAPEGSSCSLEVLDDIAQTAPDGNVTLGQTKSALTDNPVSNRAISLWKTLYNWLELVKRGLVVAERTTFELYVSRPVDGPLINAFDKAKTLATATEALATARAELWGAAPDFTKRDELPGSLRKYVDPVLGADEGMMAQIIMNLRLICGSGSPQFDIEAAIRRGPVSEARVSDIADKLCGWVKRQVDKQLEKDLPAFIMRDDFHHEHVSYVRRVDQSLILASLSRTPSQAEKLARMPDCFVQQLDLIEIGFDDKLEAISDFMRACSDRTIWSEHGDIHDESFKELDEVLCRTWKNLDRAGRAEAASRSEVQSGQLLHGRCMGHQARVQGLEPPPHFVPGCFHRLADNMMIGWHPRYRDFLRDVE